MPQRWPWAQSRGDHGHRTAWAPDDRRQVEELMVRWRHNVPGREWGASREADGPAAPAQQPPSRPGHAQANPRR